MNIRLLLIFIFLTVAFNSLRAQVVFPYLNASTGNEGQYVVDVDTNIYMYHGNQLEKLDKNFNPIWVKTYRGLEFYSLLLSKKGSLYFLAKDSIDYTFMSNIPSIKHVGKIDNIGNIVWMNTVEDSDIKFRQLLLDRNNNLILSGEMGSSNEYALLIKFDTLGNTLFFKNFTKTFGFSNVTILNDSLGYYKCIYTNYGFEQDNVATFTYSETGDSIYAQSHIPEYSLHCYISASNYYKSRNHSDVFYSITEHSCQGNGFQRYLTVRKYKKNSIIWNKKFTGFSGSNYLINSFDEDVHENVIFTISPKYGPGNNHTRFFNMCFKIDSNGIFGGQYKTLCDYNWWPPSSQPESAKLHFLKSNVYYYDVIGHNFPSSPLSVTFLDSTLITNCSTSTPKSMSTEFNGPISNSQRDIVSSYMSPTSSLNNNVAVYAIPNFTINLNYCMALNIKEPNKDHPISFYPNPTNNTLNISTTVNYSITESIVLDVTGKVVLSNNTQTKIDVSKLNSGIYFIIVKTDKGEFKQKFIKE